MLRGDSWLLPTSTDSERSTSAVRLHRGSLAVINGEAPFTVSSDPESCIEPLYVLEDSTTCTDGSGRVFDPGELMLGARTCGERLDGEHAMLAASYRTAGAAADRVLSALPNVVLIHERRQPAPLTLIEDEITRDEPGQQAVLDRLIDLLLVSALRDWFALPGTDTPAWYRAMSDPIVGPPLRAIHDRPSAPWTVELLAREAKVSRAAFARRFTGLLGEAPIAYLTGWRLGLAADLLRDTDATVETVAHQVGYSTAFTLSTAFVRQFGYRPSQYRGLAGGP